MIAYLMIMIVMINEITFIVMPAILSRLEGIGALGVIIACAFFKPAAADSLQLGFVQRAIHRLFHGDVFYSD